MIIIYGYRNSLKQGKALGVTECPNCHYYTEKKLCKEKTKFTIFYIPIFGWTKRRIIACPNCGCIKELSVEEYKKLENA